MKIDFLTLFPEMYNDFLNTSIIKRALNENKVEVNRVNIRDYSLDKHKKVDDTPYGGGAGMVLMCQPVFDAIKSVKDIDSKIILMTPQGIKYNQKIANNLSKEKHLIIVCGHYEGFDERIRDICDMEISIGDYVLTGGELPSMVIADSVIRLIPGVIDNESHENDSFNDDKLDYPTYTKPRDYEGKKVPDVLLSGDHKKISEWREQEKDKRTIERRPDLLTNKYNLNKGVLKGEMKATDFEGYSLNPKNNAKRTDVISVKNLRIVDESFIENFAKRNVEKKLQQLLILMMKVLDTESEDDDFLVLDEADRLKSLLLGEYVKVLGVQYRESILKRIDYIIKEFKMKKRYNSNEIIEKTGRIR